MKERVVITLAGDKADVIFKYSEPLMRIYSSKIGADFKVIRTPLIRNLYGIQVYFEKLQIYDLGKEYSRILFLDVDVFINPLSPDLFEIVDKDKVGVVEDGGKIEGCIRYANELFGKTDWKSPYWNSGVILVSRKHLDFFDHKRYGRDILLKANKLAYPEQSFLNYIFQRERVPLQYLDTCWNERRYYEKGRFGLNMEYFEEEGKDKIFFLHIFRPIRKRMELIKYYHDKLLRIALKEGLCKAIKMKE